jgi:hypothetical protein
MPRRALVLVAAFAVAIAVSPALAATGVRLAVVRCPTTQGVQQPLPKVPATVSVPLPASAAAAIAAYSNGYLTALAPRGWRCRGQIGADGSGSLFVTPAGAGSPTQPAVTVEYGDTPGVSASEACSLFAAARRQLALPSCPVRAPARERVVVLSRSEVAFEDPPGVHGDGLPSGGSDPANGVMFFTPSSTTAEGYSLTETCTLPAAAHARCTAILDSAARAVVQQSGG